MKCEFVELEEEFREEFKVFFCRGWCMNVFLIFLEMKLEKVFYC